MTEKSPTYTMLHTQTQNRCLRVPHGPNDLGIRVESNPGLATKCVLELYRGGLPTSIKEGHFLQAALPAVPQGFSGKRTQIPHWAPAARCDSARPLLLCCSGTSCSAFSRNIRHPELRERIKQLLSFQDSTTLFRHSQVFNTSAGGGLPWKSVCISDKTKSTSEECLTDASLLHSVCEPLRTLMQSVSQMTPRCNRG